MPQRISRKEARSLGRVHYFTGQTCKNGHVAYRFVCNTTCVPCQRERDRKQYDKTPASLRAMKARDKHLRLAYGIDIVEYQRMMVEQDGRCACCRNLTNKLMVDHNHETGQVRGLLCVNCNFVVGHASDNPQRLQLAIEYLEKFG